MDEQNLPDRGAFMAQAGALLDALEEKDRLIALLQRQLRQSAIELALFGKAPGRLTDAMGEGLPVSFESEYFLVATCDLCDKSELFDEQGKPLLPELEVHGVKDIIFQSFEEYLGKLCIAYCCESDRFFGDILINLPDLGDLAQPLEDEEALLAEMDKAVDAIERYCGVRLYLAMSRVVRSFARLPRAKAEAYHMLSALQASGSAQRVVGGSRLPRPGQVHGDGDAQPSAWAGADQAALRLRSRLERQFFQNLVTHDLEGAGETLGLLLSQDAGFDKPLAEQVRNVKRHLESVLGILGCDKSGEPALWNLFYGLDGVASKKELPVLVSEFFALLGSREQSRSAASASIRLIRDYAEMNFTDYNVSLSGICCRFGVNQSYISRAFKSMYGTGILEFIQTRRIALAKELLAATDKSIDEILCAAGFTNRRTFDRTFKQLEGTTAAAYRKANR